MLRNKEFRRFAILFSCIVAVTVILGFAINELAGVLAVFAAVVYGTAFFMFTRARYKTIGRISDQINRVLHNEEQLYLHEAEEGELSILHSEITKMTLRIREQNDALKREKQNLADSLADIAHQLRTPLTSATLTLSLLEKNQDDKERKAFVRETEELLVRMDWLITSLLKLSRLDAGVVVFQAEQTEAKELIYASLHPLLIPMELHGIGVDIDAPEGIIIRGDSGWFAQAIQNILKNCMESVGENGTIEINCTENPLFTELTIHDSGAGFEPEDLASLFDRFYRGKKSSTAGYGIGLALGKMIITRQGGSLTAKNHPRGGAMFSIRFPK